MSQTEIFFSEAEDLKNENQSLKLQIKKTVSYAPGNIPTAKQEQTADTRKDDTAETGTTKADGKQDAAKTEDKTADDKKPDEQKPAGEAKKTEEVYS